MPVQPADYAAVAADSTPSRLADKPKFAALLGVYAATFQRVDDFVLAVNTALAIDDATGVQLDNLGALVGQSRSGGAWPNGESDDAYRPKIVARSLANRSCGTTPELQLILSILLGASLQPNGVKITDHYPASFIVNLLCASPLTDQQVEDCKTFIMLAKPASVGVSASWSVGPVFAWQGFPSPPGKGFDDGTGTVGGKWATYFLPPNP